MQHYKVEKSTLRKLKFEKKTIDKTSKGDLEARRLIKRAKNLKKGLKKGLEALRLIKSVIYLKKR